MCRQRVSPLRRHRDQRCHETRQIDPLPNAQSCSPIKS
jgi:hypothetical protein